MEIISNLIDSIKTMIIFLRALFKVGGRITRRFVKGLYYVIVKNPTMPKTIGFIATLGLAIFVACKTAYHWGILSLVFGGISPSVYLCLFSSKLDDYEYNEKILYEVDEILEKDIVKALKRVRKNKHRQHCDDTEFILKNKKINFLED